MKERKERERWFLEERVNKRERVPPLCVDKKEMRRKKEEKSFFGRKGEREKRKERKEGEEDFLEGRVSEKLSAWCVNGREIGEWRSFLEGREGRNVAGIVGRSEG